MKAVFAALLVVCTFGVAGVVPAAAAAVGSITTFPAPPGQVVPPRDSRDR